MNKVYNVNEERGNFFSVLGETNLSQIATMTLEPGGSSGAGDDHPGDQVVYIIDGTATVIIEDEEYQVPQGHAIIIPKGSDHEINNQSTKELFILNIYTPPAY